MSPLAAVAVLVALLARSRGARGALLGAAVATSLISVALSLSVVQSWCATTLPRHMVEHVVVMFVIPLGATVALSPRCRGPWWAPVVAINLVMVISHLPSVFDWLMLHDSWRQWIIEPSYVALGVWFFSVVLAPHGIRFRWQLLSLLVTMATMTTLAMAMSIFSQNLWYPSMESMPGMVMESDVASQHLAAAILWICGDVWAVPLIAYLFSRLSAREGGLLEAFDRYSDRSAL